MHVVLRHAELFEITAHGLGGYSRVAQGPDGRAGRALRELLAVLAQDQPVMDELGRPRAERLEQPPVQRLVRAVIVPAQEMRDPEVDVVYDRRELVGRRAVLS